MFLRRKSIATESDEDLVARVRKGDQAGLGDLWDRYAHLLFGVGMKYLKDTERSKDCVIELFTELPALLAKHQVERLRPWIHTVMRNRCLLLLRGAKHHEELKEDRSLPAPVEEVGEAQLREADLQRLENAIEQLNDLQRDCIRLFHLERLCYEQVAQRTSLSVEQVRSNLQNGRRNLRIILQHHVDQQAR